MRPSIHRVPRQFPSKETQDGLLSGIPARHQQAILKILLVAAMANDRAAERIHTYRRAAAAGRWKMWIGRCSAESVASRNASLYVGCG